jgi:alpha-mannosidase
MALTLLRSVGWLSRDDFDTRRRRNAGPIVPTPGAQCFGEHRFRYALLPLGGDRGRAELNQLNRRWRVPPLSLQGVAEGAVPGGTGLLEVRGDGVRVSAIKHHQTGKALVVRLYNPRAEPARAGLSLGRTIARAWRVDLLEAREEELAHEPRELAVDLAPHAILTLEIEFA